MKKEKDQICIKVIKTTNIWRKVEKAKTTYIWDRKEYKSRNIKTRFLF